MRLLERYRFGLSCPPAPVGLLYRGIMPNRVGEAVVLESPDPVEGGKLHVIEASQGPEATNLIRIEETDCLSQRVVTLSPLLLTEGSMPVSASGSV